MMEPINTPDTKHELQVLIDTLQLRDNNSVNDMNSMFHTPRIEDRLILADCRAMDALMAICTIARYIMKNEE